MGRRYTQEVSKNKDLITYTVSVAGKVKGEFVGAKQAAKAFAAEQSGQGVVTITKSRVQIPKDKCTKE